MSGTESSLRGEAGVLGIHHVTVIVADPGRALDFYERVLGLRLVKRTVNFEDPSTWHLYVGGPKGQPGTLLTFFAWPEGTGGRVGVGQMVDVAFNVAPGAFGFWIDRFLAEGVRFNSPERRVTGPAIAEMVLPFRDPDGLRLQLVQNPDAPTIDDRSDVAGVPGPVRPRGIHHVTAWVRDEPAVAEFLNDAAGLRPTGRFGTTTRFVAEGQPVGRLLDVREVGGFVEGVEGTGTVHHVAWSVRDDAGLDGIRRRLLDMGSDVSEPIDRGYYGRSMPVTQEVCCMSSRRSSRD